MIEWKIKTTDGPGGEVIVSKEQGFLDSHLAINLGGKGEHLSIHLTAREARLIARALRDSVVGVRNNRRRSVKDPPWLAGGWKY